MNRNPNLDPQVRVLRRTRNPTPIRRLGLVNPNPNRCLQVRVVPTLTRTTGPRAELVFVPQHKKEKAKRKRVRGLEARKYIESHMKRVFRQTRRPTSLSATKTRTQRLLPHKREKATRKRFRGLKAKKYSEPNRNVFSATGKMARASAFFAE